MTQQEKEILSQYASAKRQASEAKDIVDTLKDTVVDIVAKYTGDEAGDKCVTDDGTFSISKRRKYEYPHEVLSGEEKLKEQIKQLKLESEQRGSGEYVETTSLTFKSI